MIRDRRQVTRPRNAAAPLFGHRAARPSPSPGGQATPIAKAAARIQIPEPPQAAAIDADATMRTAQGGGNAPGRPGSP